MSQTDKKNKTPGVQSYLMSKLVSSYSKSLSFRSVIRLLPKRTKHLSISPPEAMQTVFMKYCWPNLGNRMGHCKGSHLQRCLVSTFASTPGLYRLQLCRVMSFGQLLSLELMQTIAKYFNKWCI